ncbi:MAG: cupin domain-containing protein [Patescibacteria group bacterium]|jgi:quercetin dioxygenase-like cupin family protein
MKKDNLNSNPELSWTFLDGSKRTAGILETVAIGKGEYLPGWKWSTHAGAMTGKESERHVGYVLSGEMVIKNSNGDEITVGPGEAFEADPGHDAWVAGNVPCVALDFTHLGLKK